MPSPARLPAPGRVSSPWCSFFRVLQVGQPLPLTAADRVGGERGAPEGALEAQRHARERRGIGGLAEVMPTSVAHHANRLGPVAHHHLNLIRLIHGLSNHSV